MAQAQRVLVLGAFGLIGTEVTDVLMREGHKVSGLGRSVALAGPLADRITVIQQDLTVLLSKEDWLPALAEFDWVVYCAGALREGPTDDFNRLHHLAIAALAQAAVQRDVAVIQNSAVGAGLQAEMEFMRSKARGDLALT